MTGTTIVTLRMDDRSQAEFDALRAQYYPLALNRIAAHLTLFHTLPPSAETRESLLRETERVTAFDVRITTLRSLGRGVAYFAESKELTALHRRLAAAFEPELTAQDKQGFRPHVVVQNKVSGDEAKRTLTALAADFVPWIARGVGLDWWDYLGGPWALNERFAFAPEITAPE